MAQVDIDLRVQNRQAIGALKQFDRSVNQSGVFLGNLAANLATGALQAFGRAAVGAFTEVVKAAADIEQTSIQFRVLIGDAEEAEIVLQRVADFAASTPFTNPDVERAAKQLLTFGVAADDILPRLMNLGDISAVAGVNIGSLATIFGQVSAAGKLTGERLLQLEERGVGVRKVLAQELGVSVSQVTDQISAGAVSADVFGRALLRLSQDGGAASGGIDQLSMSYAGALATFESGGIALRREVGGQILPFLTAGLKTLNDAFGSSTDSSRGFALQVGVAFGEFSLYVVDTFQTIIENINPIIGTFRAIGNAALLLVSALRTGFTAIASIIVNIIGENIKVAIRALVALNERFDLLVPDSLITNLMAVSAAVGTTSDIIDSTTREAITATQQRLDDLGNSFSQVISDETIAGIQTRLGTLRAELVGLTDDAAGALLAQGENRTQADQAEIIKDRMKKAMLVQAQITHTARLLDIQRAANDALTILGIENEIANLESATVNDASEIAAVQTKQNMIVEIQRMAALRAAAIETDTNKRQILLAKANATATLNIEKNRIAASQRLKAAETRSDAGFATARDQLISTGLSLAKQGSLEYKALAIAQATINAYAGASRAFVDYPYPASQAVAASAIIAGLAQVHQITSVGSFQGGGLIPGSSFSGDRLQANVNSGELILNRAQQGNIAGELRSSDAANERLSAIENLLSRPLVIQNANGQMFAELTREGVRDGVNLND